MYAWGCTCEGMIRNKIIKPIIMIHQHKKVIWSESVSNYKLHKLIECKRKYQFLIFWQMQISYN